jgi:hypothetical protein
MAVIALWLGHESLETTHVYVEADLATKEGALEKLAPMSRMPARYRADDKLLARCSGRCAVLVPADRLGRHACRRKIPHSSVCVVRLS